MANWKRLVEVTSIFSKFQQHVSIYVTCVHTHTINTIVLCLLVSFQMAVEMFDYLDDIIALQATSKCGVIATASQTTVATLNNPNRFPI